MRVLAVLALRFGVKGELLERLFGFVFVVLGLSLFAQLGGRFFIKLLLQEEVVVAGAFRGRFRFY